MLKQFVVLISILYICNGEELVIELPDLGYLKGFVETGLGRKYYAFNGIPFAKPPIGSLRFEEPQPVEKWRGIRIANFTVTCTQYNIYVPEGISPYGGDEDCLYLNVFIPVEAFKSNKTLPVIVDFHASAFMVSSPNDYSGPDYFMDYNVILITANYRIGPFGFLSTENSIVPGNMGMKDQVAALKFIKKYISNFGGDPNSVTLSGLTSGGSSVHYHYLSPLSKGLFKGGVSFTGTALSPSALQKEPLLKARIIANEVGCNVIPTSELVRCLKSRPAKQIALATKALFVWSTSPISPLGPVVERGSKNPFLSDHPYILMEKGLINDLPWIVTTTTLPGLFQVATFFRKPEGQKELLKNWSHYCPAIFDLQYTVDNEDLTKMCYKIQQSYAINGTSLVKNLAEAISDRYFKIDMEESIRLQRRANKQPIYAYVFNYTSKSQPSFVNIYAPSLKQGNSYGDDVLLIFKNRYQTKLSVDDVKMKNILLDLIVSFATTRKPTTKGFIWKSIGNTRNSIDYLLINSATDISMKKSSKFRFSNFWLNFDEINTKKRIIYEQK